MNACSGRSFKFCIVILLTISFLDAWSQDVQQEPNILPPSPTAAELGKYGFVPVGLATGTAQVSVPLYSFKTKDIEIPISLSYQSNGTKVDQTASWVGLNWSLEAGGVVTRIVKDDPDEGNLLMEEYEPFPDNFNLNNPEALLYLQAASEETDFDTEPDVFAYNFLGHSGKFVFDREGRPVMIPHQNLVIERFWDPQTYALGHFIITTPDGVRYTFGAVETSKTYQAGCAKNYDLPVETAWYLTKVEHPAGDVVSFYYQNAQYFYASGVSQFVTSTRELTICPEGEPSLDPLTEDSCPSRILSSVVSLQRIESLKYGTIEFNATRDRSDLPDFKLNGFVVKNRVGQVLKEFSLGYTFSQSSEFENEHTIQGELHRRMFLTSVTEKDNIGKQKKIHTFEYDDINGLPPRLSYAQDHWGYFNGKDNRDLVPRDTRKDHLGRLVFGTYGGDRSPDADYAKKGMLTKITYPTGGSSEFHYEANTYYGEKTIYPNLELFEIEETIPEDGPRSVTTPKLLPAHATQTLSFSLEVHNGVDELHDRAKITVYDVTANNTQVFTQEVEVDQFLSGELDVLADHTYNFVLNVSGFGVTGRFAFYFYPPTHEVLDNVETGGIRIAKVINHDNVTARIEEASYFYAAHDQLSQSSGKTGFAPQYYTGNRQLISCGDCDYSEKVTATLHSNSINTAFMPASNNIYYRFVTVSRGPDFNNGVEEHEFIVNFDEPGQQVWGIRNIKGAPLTNSGWNNGLEHYSRVFKKNSSGALMLLKQTFSEYAVDTANYTAIPALVVRKNYDPVCTGPVFIECDASNVEKVYRRRTCIAQHAHSWALSPFGTRCVAPGFNHETTIVGYHPCYQKPEGITIIRAQELDHLDAIKYLNIAHWFYLKRKTETIYDENSANEIETITEYSYDNPEHAQLTRQSVIDSNGKLQVSVTKYPDDYASVGNMQVLRDKHIVGVPIKSEKIVGNNKVAGSVTLYNDNGQPGEMYSYEWPTAVPYAEHNPVELIPTNYQWKLSINYDEDGGNVRQITSFKGPVKSFLWGYQNTLPIAEVINASVENVSTDFTVFHTSFEEDETQTSSEAHTGSKSHTGVFVVNAPKVNGDYIITYWEKGNGGAWTFKEIPLTITGPDHNAVIIGTSTSLVDEVRLHAVDAKMTTYTHDPLIGVTSVTDANNLTTYYEYDDLGRLEVIKDSDKNIVKRYKYHYQNEE